MNKIKLRRILMLGGLGLLIPFFQNCGELAPIAPDSSLSASSLCAQPSLALVNGGTALYSKTCASCHGALAVSSISDKTSQQIQTALGPGAGAVPAMNGLASGLSSDDIASLASALSTKNAATMKQCNITLNTSNFTRSSTEAMQSRVKVLFPSADLSSMTSPTQPLGQALGTPDFLTSFSVVQPDSAAAQASFQKYVAANLCKNASTTSTLFSTQDILMSGESLPTDPDILMAFAAARNVWLAPYLASSAEVQVLVTLIKQLKADTAPASEIQQAVCLATLSAPQFWMGNAGKYEPIKRVAIDIGRRRPTFSEFSQYNSGALTLSSYIQKIQTEPNYIDSVKTWHRNWLGSMDYSQNINQRQRGFKYIWATNGATMIAGQGFIPKDPSGSLSATIPSIEQMIQNSSEYSNSEACQPFPQAFNPVTQRIQWEHKVNGSWYLVGGWKLVNGAWQSFGGSVPIGGNNVATTLADIQKAPAITVNVSFHYTTGAMANLPAFGPGDRRVRRFTVPDDVAPNAAPPASEQNGYSLVNLWWSGQQVYVCNAFQRFLDTCAYRPATKGMMTTSALGWNALSTAQIVANMGGNNYIGVDSLAHPTVINDLKCSISLTNTSQNFSNTGTPNNVVINGELNFSTGLYSKYDATLKEHDALLSVLQDMRDEPSNLVADIVSNNMDYRKLLTADWTFTRGPLELMYRIQGQYLANYPPGLDRVPGSAPDYMTKEKVYPMTDFVRLPRAFFANSLGNQVGQNAAHVFDDTAGAVSPIDDPNLPDLAPRPISGVLTQAAFLGSAVPKMRSVSAKILRTFTCGEVNTYVPTSSEQVLQLPFIPVSEKSGSQHVDPKGACFGCHINMDPLASALSKGFRLKVNPFTNQPINNSSEWLYGFGELAPYVSDETGIGYKYGVRGNMDLPSDGALFGHAVSGVREVGEVLANSDLFAQCAVIQAFTAVFGRPPNLPSEQSLIDSVKQQWIDSGYNYNKMIQFLVVSPQFQVRN